MCIPISCYIKQNNNLYNIYNNFSEIFSSHWNQPSSQIFYYFNNLHNTNEKLTNTTFTANALHNCSPPKTKDRKYKINCIPRIILVLFRYTRTSSSSSFLLCVSTGARQKIHPLPIAIIHVYTPIVHPAFNRNSKAINNNTTDIVRHRIFVFA